jgi:uncharacterized protein (DUF58 family)
MNLRQNALALIALIGILGIAGQWGDDPDLAQLWLLPAALLLLGLAYELWMVQRTKLTLAIQGAARGFLGRAFALSFSYSHALARTVEVEFKPSSPESFDLPLDTRQVSLPAGVSRELEFRTTPRRLGRYEWPAPRVRVGGVLGLAWWGRKVVPEYHVEISPELLDDETRRHGAASIGSKIRPVMGAGSEILQLRNYAPGDPLHLVDWKATARRDQLISRDYTEDQHLEIVIALDCGRSSGLRAGDMDRLGHYANVAARFAEHAVLQDDRVGLVLYADKPLAVFAPARGTGAVLRIRGALSAMKVAPAESNPLNAAVRIRKLVRHRSLIVLLTDLDDATVASQLAGAARLLLPKHLPLIAGLASPEAESLAQREARDWRDPYDALAAQEYCNRLSSNVRALRALGAPALIAKPQLLERAVMNAYADFRSRRRI